MYLCDVSCTQKKKKVTWFSQQFQFYNKKFEKVWQNIGKWCWVPLIYVTVFFFVTVSPTLFDGDDTCFILYFVEVLSDPIPWVKAL